MTVRPRWLPMSDVAGPGSMATMSQKLAPPVTTCPPTRNQVNIWLGQSAAPHLPVFNELTVFVIEGAVDPARFDRAVQTVIDETDALRMVVSDAGSSMTLGIRDELKYSSAVLDLSLTMDPDAALDSWARGHVDTVLDLSERLFESTLVTLSPDRSAWALLQHHLVSDATSMTIVFTRVSEEYVRIADHSGTDPAKHPQFADYLAHDKAFRTTAKYQRNESFWEERVASPGEPMVFFDGRSLTGALGRRRVHHEVDLGTERSQALRQLAAGPGFRFVSSDLSLFGVFASALLVQLFRLGGAARRTIGVPWQNRTAGDADTVGLLMEQAPFTVELDDADSFASVAHKVHAEALDVMRHLPYAAGNPGGRLYDVALNLVKVAVGPFAGMAVEPHWYRPSHGEGSFLVNVFDLTGSGELRIGLDFNEQMFTSAQREATIGQLLGILDRLIADPSQPVTGFEILTESEHLLLSAWNGTARSYPHESTTVDLVEAQVAARPDAIAARCGDDALSYRDLDRRAEALSRRLRELGAIPGTYVGICLERSLDMLVAVLAVMKSGAAYVPLDPAFPSERLGFMLQDSGASVLITERAGAEALDTRGCSVVEIDTVNLDDMPHTSPVAARAGPEDVAYVLYTSGSTGLPKGVEVPHRALTNFLWSMRDLPGCGDHDVVLAVTTLSFDISGLELYLPLVSGGQVEIAPRSMAADGRRLRERLDRGGITLLQATPATWRMLLEAGWTGTAGLKALIGGEALPPDMVRPLLDRTTSVWNMYGPTETTIWSSLDRIEDTEQPITIGRPIANTTFHVLDRFGERVPIGVAGELYIGGDGLAIGYHDRPELTAERFVSGSIDGGGDTRLYRTGDLVRYLADGRIVHLGRMDSQVKIRGYRIELSEIEAVLAEHPSVARAVVDARPAPTGVSALVAYCEPQDGRPLNVHELRESLRRRLPDFMVPSIFVEIDKVPLTPNGKVDRRSLPAPESARIVAGTTTAPRTPVESELAEIWKALLGVAQVGVEDDFFDLGGHSLLALQMLIRIEATFGVDIPLRRMLETSTVQGLSVLIERGDGPGRELLRGDRFVPTIAQVWSDVLGVPEVGPDDDFFSLQGDRSMLTEMFVRTRHQLGIVAEGLSEVEFRRTPTVRGLATQIARNSQRDTSLVETLRPEGDGTPLFLIHAGGGYAFFYRALAGQLESGRPVYGIRAENPEDGWGSPFVEANDIESVATRYLEEIERVQAQGPYLLGGACAGGVIAFEIARQLRARGQDLAGPVVLFDSILSNNPALSPAEVVVLQDAGIYPVSRLRDLRQAFARRLVEARAMRPVAGAAYITGAAFRRAWRKVRRTTSGLTARIGNGSLARDDGHGDTRGSASTPEELQRLEMAENLAVATRCSKAYLPQEADLALVCFEAARTGPLGLSWRGIAKRGLVVLPVPGGHLDMLEHPWVVETAALVDEHLSAQR